MKELMAYALDYGAPDLIVGGNTHLQKELWPDTQEQRVNVNSSHFMAILIHSSMAQLQECSTQSKEETNCREDPLGYGKEYGEIKKGMEWKVEGMMLNVSGLGPIPDCSEKHCGRKRRIQSNQLLSREE